MTSTGRDIVCVGFSDWDKAVLTNEQHLLTRMAADNRILFVESLGLRRPQVAGRDIKRMGRRLVRGLSRVREKDGVHILSPLVLPVHDKAAARRFNGTVLPALVQRAVRELGMRDVVLLSFVPQADWLLPRLKPARVIYYVDDDHASRNHIDGVSFRAAEERFARAADAVLASAPALVERMRTLNDNVHFAPNVADTRAFAAALEPGEVDPAVAALPAPRVAFIGGIVATAIDLELVEGLARARPDWSFPFVGPVGMGDPHTDVSVLRTLPNVHLLGVRPYEALPAVLRGADAAVIPYRTGGEMESVFPMKTYEYLAAGLPVVTSALPALAGVEDVVRAEGVDAWAAALEDALAEDSPAARRARSDRAQVHSWEARIAQIGAVLDDLDRVPTR